VPGKRSQTDRLTAPAGAIAPGSSTSATTLSGTAWLDGLLGFTGSHDPTGECRCAGCVAGRVTAQGLNGPEDVPVNEVKSEAGGGGEGGGGGQQAAATAAAAPVAPSAPGTQAQQAPTQSKAPAQPAEAQPAEAQQAQSGKDPAEQGAGAAGKAATPPPPPTITSATRKAAPGGAASARTTVGIGEVIDFTGSAAGTWTATGGTPATAASGTTFAWTAPAAPAAVTITLTVGTQTATKEITVIAPSSLSMVVSSSHPLTAGTAGVCMITNVTVGPTTVSFGNTEWLEVPGPAAGISGYFKQFSAATLYHNPNAAWVRWNDRNTGPRDHAAWHAVPSPYSPGGFHWSIPNKYRVAGSGAEAEFTTTTQLFQMTDKAGTMSVSKAGASASRTP